jgi:hypothetical protein
VIGCAVGAIMCEIVAPATGGAHGACFLMPARVPGRVVPLAQSGKVGEACGGGRRLIELKNRNQL